MHAQDAQQHVGNGRAYAVCSCHASESESSDKCGFRTGDLAKMAVACDEGYAVKVKLSVQKGQSSMSKKARFAQYVAFLYRAGMLLYLSRSSCDVAVHHECRPGCF